MTPTRNPHTDPTAPTGCPVCHSDAIRATTPLAPEREDFVCERCEHGWSE